MKVGDKVQLNSGSPIMTISEIIEAQTQNHLPILKRELNPTKAGVVCKWYNEKEARFEKETFNPSILKIVE